MFFRLSKSKGREYLQLMESYRAGWTAGRQSRHRLLAGLGRVDELTRAQRLRLVRSLERALGVGG